MTNAPYVMGGMDLIHVAHDDACWGAPLFGDKHHAMLPFPVARIHSVTLNGQPQTVGIKGVDNGRDWYFAIGDAILTRDTQAPRLAEGDMVHVDYDGQYPTASDPQEAAWRAS